MKESMNMTKRVAASVALSISAMGLAHAGSSSEIGSVDTSFQWIGANHKIVVEVFDDPMVEGVSCYVSRAKTGGVKGSLGIATDTSDASVACRQVGEIKIAKPLPRSGEVFSQSSSILFKSIRVQRMVDSKRNTLVYIVYSDKLIDGSPKNSVTAVPVPRATPIPAK